MRVVPPRSLQAPRAPFVALVVGLLAAGLLGLLLLNTVIAEDSFQLHTLQQRGNALDLQQQQLQRDIDALEAPTALAARARAMGMVPAGSPAFIRLSDGKVLGVPEPATSPVPIRLASPKPSAAAPAAAARTPKPAATAPFPAPAPQPSPR
ncbi:MAG: hypothetical protein DLM59_03360 [Pseudonocardiales bacterium]|nr:MAG: hypothetical protein DLM59_03360 [Pseudonocardiales bacterium]